jgi:MFS family permease
MPLYLRSLGFPTSQWLTIWGTVWLANIVFNLVAGYVGDIFGWKKIICIVGGVCGAVFTIGFFYTPAIFGHNYIALMIAGLLLGAAVAGFVPMDAVVANYLPDSKGAAISSMNFGAGLSSLVGPLIVAVVAVPLGYSGVAWILAGLYVFVAITIWFVSPRQRAAADQQSLQLQGKD